MKITIGYIYPKLLNMFGDIGNITALKKRCEWRNIEVCVKEFHTGDEIDLTDIDILYLGGGGERETLISLENLMNCKETLKNFVEDNGVMLAVCSGYEISGIEFYVDNKPKAGLSLVNIKSEQGSKRFVSNVVLETEFGKIAGFENHLGRMKTGIHSPLGKVIYGNGNNGEDGAEGVLYKNFFGTYLDGPILPKNPELCDELIKRALIRKGENGELFKLDDSVELKAKEYIITKYAEKRV